MTTPPPAPDAAPDAARLARAELAISRILRLGVAASLAFMVAGTALTFVHHPEYLTDRRALVGMAEVGADFPRSLPAVARALIGGDGRARALVVLGLLLLIATPVARVVASITVFARTRDRPLAALTTLVLLLLILSFILGRVE